MSDVDCAYRGCDATLPSGDAVYQRMSTGTARPFCTLAHAVTEAALREDDEREDTFAWRAERSLDKRLTWPGVTL